MTLEEIILVGAGEPVVTVTRLTLTALDTAVTIICSQQIVVYQQVAQVG